jgi:hypothetical protein
MITTLISAVALIVALLTLWYVERTIRDMED